MFALDCFVIYRYYVTLQSTIQIHTLLYVVGRC